MTTVQSRVLGAVILLAAFAGGSLMARSVLADDDSRDATEVEGGSGESSLGGGEEDIQEPVITATSVPMTTTTLFDLSSTPVDPVVQVFTVAPPTAEEALDMAGALADGIRLPSDCGIPLDVPESLPNSPREYRSGTHRGIDFICMERGRGGSAAMPGRVLVAVGDYQDPTPEERSAVLGIAAETGVTPPWTLAMMYGNYVVIDHGVIPGVGHVVSIYAHFDSLDESITPGVAVEAGQLLGEIGNKGTNAASQGTERPQSIHLHWELYVDDLFLGAGLGYSDTREIYSTLFQESL